MELHFRCGFMAQTFSYQQWGEMFRISLDFAFVSLCEQRSARISIQESNSLPFKILFVDRALYIQRTADPLCRQVNILCDGSLRRRRSISSSESRLAEVAKSCFSVRNLTQQVFLFASRTRLRNLFRDPPVFREFSDEKNQL